MEQRAAGPMRDLGLVRLSSWGRVVPAGGVVAFEVVGDDGCVIQPMAPAIRESSPTASAKPKLIRTRR